MKLTLMIEGSASALAVVLANLPQDVDFVAGPVPLPPMPGMNSPTQSDDDEGPANAAPPAVDSTGLPWDARIHSDKKGTKEDGTWRLRRNVDKALVPVVEAELRARAGVPAPAPVMVPPPQMAQPMPIPNAAMSPVSMAPAPAPAPQPMAAAPVMVPPPQVIPPMPVNPEPAPVAAPVAAPTEGLDFAGVMQHLAPKFNERDAAGQPVVGAEFLAGLAAQVGQAYQVQLTSITDLSLPQNAHMIPYLVQLLQHYGKW